MYPVPSNEEFRTIGAIWCVELRAYYAAQDIAQGLHRYLDLKLRDMLTSPQKQYLEYYIGYVPFGNKASV